jgi:hypothetical protein
MNHETETLEPEISDPHADARRGMTLLSSIYLEAGLPLELAIEAAAADCDLFEEELLCA